VLAGLSGDVLEIGGGTRDGPALLRPGDHIADADRGAASDAASPRARGREHCPSATVLRAPAGDLPFDDHTFDVAVSTLVLCGVDDQPRAWRELRRVLRPGGQLLFIEHVCAGCPARAVR
jgi:ubiquinone/menaquinone biosynthesis C-methylase UbiE